MKWGPSLCSLLAIGIPVMGPNMGGPEPIYRASLTMPPGALSLIRLGQRLSGRALSMHKAQRPAAAGGSQGCGDAHGGAERCAEEPGSGNSGQAPVAGGTRSQR